LPPAGVAMEGRNPPMNATIDRLAHHPDHIDAQPLRFRAELPAVRGRPPLPAVCDAAHDFLVPNPRPDLTFDPHTLLMIAPR
jgi:hypothetical protein